MKAKICALIPTLNSEKTSETEKKNLADILIESKYEFAGLAITLAVYLILHSLVRMVLKCHVAIASIDLPLTRELFLTVRLISTEKRSRPGNSLIKTKECLYCKQSFKPKNSKAQFCSTKHRVAYFRAKRNSQPAAAIDVLPMLPGLEQKPMLPNIPAADGNELLNWLLSKLAKPSEIQKNATISENITISKQIIVKTATANKAEKQTSVILQTFRKIKKKMVDQI